MTTAWYEIETHEEADGTAHPDPRGHGRGADRFLAHGGLHITGIGGPHDDEGVYPSAFVALEHEPWLAVIEVAAAYMDRIHG
ncbi:hypothetical protein [Streptomyces sp. NPDC050856]|uniref:hypothetical protein n=1 Tax=Streptomyces sp. NPDC050856 TaxID=3154939 RepID=UPI0033F37214